MTWKTFIDTIRESGIISGSSAKILTELFKIAGAMNEVNEETTRTWINGKRKCDVHRYFPEGKITNETALLNYLKNRPKGKLISLQNGFKKIGDISDSPINLKTDEMNIFCESLLNQFLDLLGFERLNTLDYSKKATDLKFTPFIANNIVESFKNSAEYYHITDFITHEPDLITLNLLTRHYDWKKLSVQFIEEIQDTIIVPFEPYKHEIVYINISQFINCFKNYNHYLNTHAIPLSFKNSNIMHNVKNVECDMNLFAETEFEKNTKRFREHLKLIYDKIYSANITS